MSDIIPQKTSIKKLKVLKIIHGYPPYYMAGSEVYTFNLCNELSKSCNVSIFTRIEDEFKKSYKISENNENGIMITRVNKPGRDYTFRSKYIDKKMEHIFEDYLIKVNPDIVHIGHLSHLTILIVKVIKKHRIPIIFTLHDFWMMCIRGQLIKDDLTICEGPKLEKCAECNGKYFLSHNDAKKEMKSLMEKFSYINGQIDLFIAPSRFLKKKYIEYGIPEHKLQYLDYGFNKELFKTNQKISSKKIRFGYIGRIIPVKGIKILIKAFNKVDHNIAELNIYGNLSKSLLYLKTRCKNSAINFQGPFLYKDIGKIFSNIDILIVPSIWYENSPLVIHEGFLAGVPIITSNLGGMAELVENGKNGLLFEYGNAKDLREKINELIQNTDLIEKLSQSKNYVRSIQQDAQDLIKLYQSVINKNKYK